MFITQRCLIARKLPRPPLWLGKRRASIAFGARAYQAPSLNFWITGHVADETKLWYIVPGHGYRKFSTLSHHSQVTWQLQDDGPILDEDVFRTPEAMTHYSAAVQYHILSADGCAGVNPQVGLRPQARFYGTNIVWDSHRVTFLAEVRCVCPF